LRWSRVRCEGNLWVDLMGDYRWIRVLSPTSSPMNIPIEIILISSVILYSSSFQMLVFPLGVLLK
jgi:hypothetical protein